MITYIWLRVYDNTCSMQMQRKYEHLILDLCSSLCMCCPHACVAVSCSELQCVVVRCRELIHIYIEICSFWCACFSVLQCVAVCCSVWIHFHVDICNFSHICSSVSQCVAVCCSVLQCVAVYCDCSRNKCPSWRMISTQICFADNDCNCCGRYSY